MIDFRLLILRIITVIGRECKMSKVHQLIQEDEHYFAKSGRIKYYPLVIDHGYGATLVDVEGKRISICCLARVLKM